MIEKSHGKHAEEKKVSIKKWMFYFSILVSVILVYKLLDNFASILAWVRTLFGILTPFVAGLVIAYILYLPCRKVEQAYKTTKPTCFLNKHARGISVTTVYIMTVIVLFIIFSYVIPILVQSLSDLISNIPNFYNSVTKQINSLPADSFLRSNEVSNIIKEIGNFDYKSLLDLNKLTEYAKSAISAVKSIFDMFVAIVVSVYILCQRKRLVDAFLRWNHAIVSEKTYQKISKYFKEGNEIFFRFLTSQIIDALIVGVILTIAMMILRVKYAVLLGFMIGLFNLIPFFGAIVAVVIAIIITILTGGIWQATLMAIVVIILQQIDANIINPKIVGDSLSISQLLVIFAVTIGGAYFGVLGMFLAVPVITVIKMLIDDVINEREEAKHMEKYQEEPEE
jgi:predicted PurR-regulated permease PerM